MSSSSDIIPLNSNINKVNKKKKEKKKKKKFDTFIKDNVKIVASNRKGRYGIANIDLNEGDLILSEQPFFHI